MRRRRSDEQIESRMRAPRVEHFGRRRILNALELLDALFRLIAFGAIDLSRVELRLQFFFESRRFLLRLETGTIDGAMAGLATIDAWHRHVVNVDEEVLHHDLIDFERRRDEVEHRRVEQEEVPAR